MTQSAFARDPSSPQMILIRALLVTVLLLVLFGTVACGGGTY